MNTPENINSNPYFPLFSKQKNKQPEVVLRTAAQRISVLKKLSKSILQNKEGFREALYKDFRKPKTETDITELYPVLSEIRYASARLRNWLRPERIPNNLAFTGTKSKVLRTGKGVCLILSPWNYPVSLTLGPLVSAIAAGNTAIIKPSEKIPHTSKFLAEFISSIFPEDEVTVIEGSHETAEKLLELPFDNIHFTGSAEVGKKIMKAAANNLVPVTLELGGKSPVYIHHDCNLQDAAAKITAAKLVNSGQTCLAPDYILVHHDVKEELVMLLSRSFKLFYDPEHPEIRKNYASIVNEQHYARLESLLIHKNLRRTSDLLFEPVIETNLTPNHQAMKEEIFGPLLPVLGVINAEEAIKQIHALPDPLGIYVFTADNGIKEQFRKSTRSGCLSFNECALHFLHPGLPFGGTGQSGMGRAHGKAGFIAFSNERVIFEQRRGFTMAKMLYPPYNKIKLKIIDLLLKYF